MADNEDGKPEGEDSDDEFKQDDEGIDPDEIIVREIDMDQYLKGDRIDKIGLDEQLGEDERFELKKRDKLGNDDDDEDDDGDGGNAGAKDSNNFFAQQRAARKKAEMSRKDKHLLPTKFKSEFN